ncbi:MAG: CCA tRNA nucleotidyltransferase [Oscillospiraceae bacterium]
MMPQLPAHVGQLIVTLKAAGAGAWLVGGALRDLMLGKTPTDWDIATTFTPQQLLDLLDGSRLTGGDTGTVRAVMGDEYCEITPCRVEGLYSDHRHPDEVLFVPDILADLARRDFTVNAMAFDGRILIDPFGGQQDLRRRILRCVGDPAERFKEDPLRVLRLFRLAAQLGFNASWPTFCAAGAAMDGIAGLPAERVLGEMNRILMSQGPQVIGPVVAQGGLHSYGFFFAPALNALAQTPAVLLCRWWALLTLCGVDFERAGAAFGFSRRFMADLEECTRLYRLGPAMNKTELKQKLSHSKLDYLPVVSTFAAVSPSFVAEPAFFAEVMAKKEPYRLGDLAINGDILYYEEGIRGKQCGTVLEELLQVVIKNPKMNRTKVLLGIARGLKQLL